MRRGARRPARLSGGAERSEVERPARKSSLAEGIGPGGRQHGSRKESWSSSRKGRAYVKKVRPCLRGVHRYRRHRRRPRWAGYRGDAAVAAAAGADEGTGQPAGEKLKPARVSLARRAPACRHERWSVSRADAPHHGTTHHARRLPVPQIGTAMGSPEGAEDQAGAGSPPISQGRQPLHSAAAAPHPSPGPADGLCRLSPQPPRDDMVVPIGSASDMRAPFSLASASHCTSLLWHCS